MRRIAFLVAMLLWLLPQFSYAQQRTISGRVTDASGMPLPLVSVQEKGTQNGTTTNDQGDFTLTLTTARPVLIFSYTGLQTQEVTVGTGSTYNVTLRAEGGTMSEVVVTALGIRREKKALGYTTQEVSGEDLQRTRQTNIVNALRGQAAGVQINSGGGSPGQGSRIVIRGIKSLDPTQNNQPLFVIDGVEMSNSTNSVSTAGELRGLSNRAADINPDDVESITVLKGGAATALYGLHGANGVVVITTKSAKAGKMRVNLSSTYGYDEVNRFPEVQRTYTQGYLGVYDTTEFFPSWGPTTEEARALDPTHPGRIFHHYARGYEGGQQFRTSLNMSGGTDNALLTSSLSYFNQEGVIPNSDYRNISARVGGQFRFSNKLRFNPSFYFINSGGLRVNADRYNESLTYWSPRWDVRDYINPNGTMKTYGNNNPIYGTHTNRFKDNVNRLIGTGEFMYSPLNWLDLTYRFGMDYWADFRRHTAPGPMGLVGEIPYEDNDLGFVDENRLSNRILNSNLMATFKKDWSSRFNTVLRVGNDVRESKYSEVNANGAELDVPDLLTLNNTKVRTNSEYQETYRIVSAYGDLALSFNNYLFLNITGRNDWTSTLNAPNNSFFYPSVSLAYAFSDHFTLPDFMSFGKVRASWAEIGKDTRPYRTSSVYTSSVITSSSQVIWTRGDRRGDPLLKPERTSTLELGTEMRFLKNRLGLDFTWYKLNSRDQIIPVAVSPTTGYGSVILNSGELENKGVELVLNGSPVKGNDFNWDVTLNFSRNRNRILSIREGLTEIVLGSQFGYAGATATMKYVPGDAVGNIYGSSYLRYYGSKTDDKNTLDRGLPLVIAATGSNRGFPVRDGTQRILGNSQPDWMAGLTNTFGYKNFTLSMLWETQQGMERYNQLGNFMAAFGIAKYTEDRNTTRVFEGVLADGAPNTQAVWLGQGVGPDGRNYSGGWYRNVYRGVTENFVEDASWVRLRNLSLSYNIPARVFQNSFVQGASVTLTGNNLLLFTDYSGFDPETSSTPAGSNVDAFTGFTYPAIRSYLFTVNFNF